MYVSYITYVYAHGILHSKIYFSTRSNRSLYASVACFWTGGGRQQEAEPPQGGTPPLRVRARNRRRRARGVLLAECGHREAVPWGLRKAYDVICS